MNMHADERAFEQRTDGVRLFKASQHQIQPLLVGWMVSWLLLLVAMTAARVLGIQHHHHHHRHEPMKQSTTNDDDDDDDDC